VRCIRGNGEDAVLAVRRGLPIDHIPEPFRDVVRWTAEQLSTEDEQWLASWPETLALDIHGLGEVLFCHATPRSNTEIFTRRTPEDVLLPAFAAAGASVIVCGHTHMQFDRRIGASRVVNAGSVGMPFGEPGADWLLLGPDVQLRHTTYDLEPAAERIRRTQYPQAQQFAARNVLQPPSEEEMLRVFTSTP
jgi:hypothetical protein